MATTHQLMTAEELLRMPDDDYRYELVRRELRKMTDMIMLTEHDTLDGGDVGPGWKIPVREIFS